MIEGERKKELAVLFKSMLIAGLAKPLIFGEKLGTDMLLPIDNVKVGTVTLVLIDMLMVADGLGLTLLR